MKYLIIFLSAFFLFAGSGKSLVAQSNTNDRDKFSVQVDGLGCPFCAYGLEKKLKSLKGIKNLEIDINTGVLSFDYPAAKKLSLQEVKKRVNLAGYTPISLKVIRSNGKTEKG